MADDEEIYLVVLGVEAVKGSFPLWMKAYPHVIGNFEPKESLDD
jgi:hypothetical protein